jgi:hypothetical protein
VLVRIDQVLDLEWLRAEVAGVYCADNDRPGIDPEGAVRLMLAGFLLGPIGYIPPAEAEEAFYANLNTLDMVA